MYPARPMAGNASAATAILSGTPLPTGWNAPRQASRVGDVVLIVFLLAQCLDGVFTYIGVATFGIDVEANPVVAGLMANLGHGPGLLSAKLVASGLGVGLHLLGVHSAIALLTGFYMMVAVAPWTLILFF